MSERDVCKYCGAEPEHQLIVKPQQPSAESPQEWPPRELVGPAPDDFVGLWSEYCRIIGTRPSVACENAARWIYGNLVEQSQQPSAENPT